MEPIGTQINGILLGNVITQIGDFNIPYLWQTNSKVTMISVIVSRAITKHMTPTIIGTGLSIEGVLDSTIVTVELNIGSGVMTSAYVVKSNNW